MGQLRVIGFDIDGIGICAVTLEIPRQLTVSRAVLYGLALQYGHCILLRINIANRTLNPVSGADVVTVAGGGSGN